MNPNCLYFLCKPSTAISIRLIVQSASVFDIYTHTETREKEIQLATRFLYDVFYFFLFCLAGSNLQLKDKSKNRLGTKEKETPFWPLATTRTSKKIKIWTSSDDDDYTVRLFPCYHHRTILGAIWQIKEKGIACNFFVFFCAAS